MKIHPTTAVIGAEISGVDLSVPIDVDTADKIYAAVIENLVLFFRNQELSPQAHLDFAMTFGTPAKPHPVYPHLPGFDQVVLLENDGDRPPDTDDWHSDLTFQSAPPFLSVLYADHIPKIGGDTLWANMYAAFDALPGEIQALVSRLSAVHDMGAFRNDFLHNGNDTTAMNKALFDIGSAVHPMAPKHPVTGKRLLFVNRSFTRQIVGMLQSDSDGLLQYLFNHINSVNFQTRFRWQNGSVAIWDNRCTQHFAVTDYLPDYRRMHRVIIDTDRRLEP